MIEPNMWRLIVTIKEKIDQEIIELSYIATEQQTTDILTKAIPRVQFDVLMSNLGMIDIHSPD